MIGRSFVSGATPAAPSAFAGQALAKAIAMTNPSSTMTPRPSAPAPVSAFLTRPSTPMRGAGAALASYTPPVLGSTAVPVAAQTSQAGSVSGVLAKLSLFGAPAPARFGAGGVSGPTTAAVTGFSAPAVFAGAPQRAPLQFRPISADPGYTTSLAAVTAAPFTGAPAMPPAQPPATNATTVTGASSQPITTALAAGSTIPAAPGGGFDPGYGWADGAYLDGGSASSATAPPTDYGKIALYGGGAVVALFALSKMFGRKAAA